MSVSNDSWISLDEKRIYKIINGNVYVIKQRDEPDPAPLFCDICSSPIMTMNDISTENEYGCCESCALKWVDIDRERWLSGWRPSAEDVNNEMIKKYSRGLKLPF